jgi:hypothetical protein
VSFNDHGDEADLDEAAALLVRSGEALTHSATEADRLRAFLMAIEGTAYNLTEPLAARLTAVAELATNALTGEAAPEGGDTWRTCIAPGCQNLRSFCSAACAGGK